MLTRRQWLSASITGAAALVLTRRLSAEPAAAGAPVPITVYKTPTCGCCKEWVKHMETNGFAVTVHDLENLDETKKSMGVPEELQSCHTGISGKYVVEGHVPADLVHKVLKEKPAILGLAVPGMPRGSPGMEMGRKDPFDVIAFEKSGKTRVYASR